MTVLRRSARIAALHARASEERPLPPPVYIFSDPSYPPHVYVFSESSYPPEDDVAEEPSYPPEDDVAEEPSYPPEDDVAEEPSYLPEDDVAEEPSYPPEKPSCSALNVRCPCYWKTQQLITMVTLCRTETEKAKSACKLFQWLILHPHLLKDVKGLHVVIKRKIEEFQRITHSFCFAYYKQYCDDLDMDTTHTVEDRIALDKYVVYQKLNVVMEIMGDLLDDIIAEPRYA